MNRSEQPEDSAVRVRSLAETGCKDAAALTLDDIRLLCEILLKSLDQRDDVVLQSRVPKSGRLFKDAVAAKAEG